MHSKRSSSSNRWLNNYFKDPYVKMSKKKNLRSRAWFKLQEIDLKYLIFKKGMNVIDLGSAPGSWSKYAIKQVGTMGNVISCDINHMNPILGVNFLQGDITNQETYNNLLKFIKYKNIHLVMSDMSPNITGISCIDIEKSLFLSRIALKIALNTLSKNGIFLLKVFQGHEVNLFIKKLNNYFKIVDIYKPHSSRIHSREIYILSKILIK